MRPHEQEICFLVNSTDPNLVEAYTNSQDLSRQLERHGAQRIPTPRGEDDSLRGQLAQRLDMIYLIKARQIRFVGVDELKRELEQRRRDRKRKAKAESEEEKAKRAEKNAYARAWRAKQTPEKKQALYDQIRQAKSQTSPYQRELKRKQERERWAKLSEAERAEIRERKRARQAAKRAEATQAQTPHLEHNIVEQRKEKPSGF